MFVAIVDFRSIYPYLRLSQLSRPGEVMYKADALKYFTAKVKNRLRSDKTGAATNLARALGISTSAVAQWDCDKPEHERIIPKGSAETLHRITFNKIQLKLFHYDKLQNKFCSNCQERNKLTAKKCLCCQHQF